MYTQRDTSVTYILPSERLKLPGFTVRGFKCRPETDADLTHFTGPDDEG